LNICAFWSRVSYLHNEIWSGPRKLDSRSSWTSTVPSANLNYSICWPPSA